MFHRILNDSFQELINSINGKSLKASLVRSSFWSLIINSVNRALMLILGVLLIRILGRTQYGIYSYYLSLVSLLIIPVEYGISNLIIRETARLEINQRTDLIIGVWRWSLCVTAIVSFTIIGLLFVFVTVWGQLVLDNQHITTLVWGMPLIILQSFVHIINAALRGMKKVILGQLTDIIVTPFIFINIFLISTIIFPNQLTAASAMVLRVISTFVAFIISFIMLVKTTPKSLIYSSPAYDVAKWIFSVIPFGLSTGLNMVKNHVSILIMGFYVMSAQIASYQVAVSTAALTAIVLHSMNTILAPQFSSFYAENEQQKLQKLITYSTRAVFIVTLFVSLIFVSFGREILKFVFGPETVDAYPALLVLLIGQLVNSFMGSVGFLLNMTGHEKVVMKIVGISTALNILVTFLLTPSFGIIGTSIANTGSLIIAQTTMFFVVRKRLGIISNAIGK